MILNPNELGCKVLSYKKLILTQISWVNIVQTVLGVLVGIQTNRVNRGYVGGIATFR